MISFQQCSGDGDKSCGGSSWNAEIRCGLDEGMPIIFPSFEERLVWSNLPVSQSSFFLLFWNHLEPKLSFHFSSTG